MPQDRALQSSGFGRQKIGEFLSVLGTMAIMAGALGVTNAMGFRHPMNPSVDIGYIVAGIICAVIGGLMRRDFSRFVASLTFYLSFVLVVYGSVRILRLAFGEPWSIVDWQTVLWIAIAIVGGVCVSFGHRRMVATGLARSLD